MISIDKIAALTENRQLLEFSEFLISEAADLPYPDYRNLDLMKIARLVSQIFVLDYRAGFDGGILVHFSGTGIDDLFGRNITGLRSNQFYSGADRDRFLTNLYTEAYHKGLPAYTRRSVHFKDAIIDKNRIVENIMFPCSSDGASINFGIGYAHYSVSIQQVASQYTLVGGDEQAFDADQQLAQNS